MDLRAALQRVIDEVQFRYDILPKLYYQPLPWLGLNHARRGEGTRARWEAIEHALAGQPIGSAMDIGCNVGYFCFALGLKGVPIIGIDMDSRLLRIAQYTSRKLGSPPIGWCNMVVNRETARLLPQVDLVLLLSVWHHWVQAYGLAVAGEILSMVWARSNRVLFFETGEAEMPDEFGLPDMGATPRDWLADYLRGVCAGAEIVHLGRFKAFAPCGDERRGVVYRNLFKVARPNDIA